MALKKEKLTFDDRRSKAQLTD